MNGLTGKMTKYIICPEYIENPQITNVGIYYFSYLLLLQYSKSITLLCSS